MCIKIRTDQLEREYDAKKPLEDQLEGCLQIVVSYEPKDKSIPVFMEELKRIAKHGIETSFNIEIVHNSHIKGAKVKKAVQKLKNDISVNEVIKALVLIHKETDGKLETLANSLSDLREAAQKFGTK